MVMAVDVSSLVTLMTGGGSNGIDSSASITRDLLGGSCGCDAQELDLDLKVPCGWEKRLNLKSGRVFLQRCNSSSSSLETEHQATPTSTTKFQDLNFPKQHQQQPLTLPQSPSLDLKLDTLSSSNYQSICTLDKVKSALARVEKETENCKRSRSLFKSSSSPPNSSSPIQDDDEKSKSKLIWTSSSSSSSSSSSAPVAARCPKCLLYVMIPKGEPRCRR